MPTSFPTPSSDKNRLTPRLTFRSVRQLPVVRKVETSTTAKASQWARSTMPCILS